MTNKKIFYNSSMPRSCSTLLSNILGQNPDFYVSPTSGVLELIFASRAEFSRSPEFKAQEQFFVKSGFLGYVKGALEGYYSIVLDKKFILDKSRGWVLMPDLLENAFAEKPKILYCHRNIKSIISSMEKMFRANPEQHKNIVNHAEMSGTTLEKRVDIWLNSQPIGLALERVRELVRKNQESYVNFIRVEDLCKNPRKELEKIYKYLEIPVFEHNFNHVEQITKEDDSIYGLSPDLHIIKSKVEPLQPDYYDILGKEICDYLDNVHPLTSWYQKYFKYKS